MKILKCHITGFGCYTDKTFDFSKNLNPYLLDNGGGKSTLAAFIKSMFYSLEKATKTSYERKHFKPYSGGEYGGSLEFELDNKIYRIERVFYDSASKDTLKIYDEHGICQNTFLSKDVSSLQGEASQALGELIFGIDAEAFKRCNFISSNDLDFSNSDSIKMKIGDVVIDKDKENTYEDTIQSINADLKDKKPTAAKKENAYPYKIKELETDIKNINNEIKQLEMEESLLPNDYSNRNKIKEDIKEIEEKQKAFSELHVLKGKTSTVDNYNKEINDLESDIASIYNKYNNDVPNTNEKNILIENIDGYEKCKTINNSFIITESDIDRLNKLEGNIVSEEDYELMFDANSKLQTLTDKSLFSIDENRFNILKNKFEGKNIKESSSLENDYIEYKTFENQKSNFNSNYQEVVKDYPSLNVLNQIDNEIKEYNDLQNQIDALKSSYKEVSPILKIILIIITLGIYLVILNKKKKEFNNFLNKYTESLNKKTNDLDSFFNKYNKTVGTYEFRLAELKDDINKYNDSKSQNEEKNKKLDEIIKAIDEKKRNLLNYFSLFGYSDINVDSLYQTYKKDLNEYNSMLKDKERNNEANNKILEDRNKQNQIINTTLAKYNLPRNEDFVKELSSIKSNIDFNNKYKPIYDNKKANDNLKDEYEKKLNAILKSHNIDINIDIILTSKEVVNDIEKMNNARENKNALKDKRDLFIKENNLSNFNLDSVEEDEEKLRLEHEQKIAELNRIEDEIDQREKNLSRKDILIESINNNQELIEEYKAKIEIINLAKNALESAEEDMKARFIEPVQNSFINYASKIYEKIGQDVTMNYDYEIKYDINGQLRDSKDLSDGERTIMMLALRFAILDSMYKKHDSVIILDDSFESLDPTKLSKAKEMVKELSKEWQIIYFTCHDSREIVLDKE